MDHVTSTRYIRSTSSSNRRDFLTGAAAAGTAGLFSAEQLFSQGKKKEEPLPSPRRLDLHHHFISPALKKRLAEVKRQGWDTFSVYEPAKDLEAMDIGGVQTAFLSCSTPGVWLGDDFRIERDMAIALSRDMNEYAARMISDHKGRFGLFALLPLPDVDASLKEIEYAFDTLHCDGVGLLTSYGDIWLGDRRLQPVFDELNRRNAIVYTHPTDAACCHNLANANPVTLEWLVDTSRSIMSILSEGGPGLGGGGNGGGGRGEGGGRGRGGGQGAQSPATRYANCKFIWSHAGGALIGVASRVVGNISTAQLATPAPMNSHLYHVRRFFYDTAGSTNPVLMQGIARLAGASQIVFGSDYPFGGQTGMKNIGDGLKTCGFTQDELRGIDRDNAVRILPKFA
jgi:predicted TIM-barrel fold metal-dependent hydrolase